MGLVKDKHLSVLLEKINPTAEPTASVSSATSAQNGLNVDSSSSAQLWITELKAASTSQKAVELYKSLPQIISPDIDPNSKFTILEILYPEVTHCTAELLSNQLSQDTAKAVSLGQALSRHTYQGYKSLAHQLSRQLDLPELEQKKGKGKRKTYRLPNNSANACFAAASSSLRINLIASAITSLDPVIFGVTCTLYTQPPAS